MKAKRDHSFPNTGLLEADVSAYFEKLLQELNELQEQIGDRDDKVHPVPGRHGREIERVRVRHREVGPDAPDLPVILKGTMTCEK